MVPATGGGWDYSLVRKANYFFENYQRCRDNFDAHKQYLGVAYFFRALIYFKLPRTFGDVQWYGKVLNTDSPELMDLSTSRNIIGDSILADLDKAALYMNAEKVSNGLRPDRWAALAPQARVALSEGSSENIMPPVPRLPWQARTRTKYFWKAAAAAEAISELRPL